MAFTDAVPAALRRLLPCALLVAVMALLVVAHETAEAAAESHPPVATGATAEQMLDQGATGSVTGVAADQDILHFAVSCGVALLCAMVLVAALHRRGHRQPSWPLGRWPSFVVMAWWSASLQHGSRRPAHLVAVLIR